MSEVIRLLAITDQPLSVDAVMAAVADPRVGGTAIFVGAVRDSDNGRSVTELDYSAHPSATATLRSVAEQIVGAHDDVLSLAAVHRVGRLHVGDVAVVVGVGCAHRHAAFAAARELIDRVKAEVPIWKRQRFEDGTDEWVGVC